MFKRVLYLVWVVFFILLGCQERADYKELLVSNELLIQANEKLTDIIVHDIFSPPVASRIYAYPSIAAYEVAVLAEPDRFISLMGQLNGAKPLDIALEQKESYSFPLASLTAYYGVAHKLVFSEQDMIDHKEAAYKKIRELGMPKTVYQNSVKLGEAVADHILKYASKDNYHQSRSFEKYTIKNDPNTWKPTPPAYMEGIEPHWNKIRPFLLDSASQFSPVPPPPFDIHPGSEFYSDAEEVMDSGNQLDEHQTDIAYFWDCNPYKMNVKGHVMYAEKKITPGGHWIGIAGIASKTKGLDWKETSETLA
ncbi:MAG: phosphatidic acid phosphatase, partial [Cyclobacteriaceae bacterium]